MFRLELWYFWSQAFLLLESIEFVTNQSDLDPLLTELIDLLEPVVLDAFEGFTVMDVKSDNYSLSIFVVGTGDSPKPLLSCGVPDLKFDKGFVYLKGSGL